MTPTRPRRSTHLLGGVEERVGNVPAHAVIHNQAPRQRRLVQVHQQARGEVPQQDAVKVEAGAGRLEKGREARQQQGEVGEARDAGDEGRGGRRRMGDVQRDSGVPEGLGDGGGHYVSCILSWGDFDALFSICEEKRRKRLKGEVVLFE